MKFGQLLYSKDEEILIIYSEDFIQDRAKILTGRELTQKELHYLKGRVYQKITNLIIKIDSSGIGKWKRK